MTHRCLTSLVMLNGVDVPSNSNSPVMIKKKNRRMLRTFFCQVCKESMKKDALFHPSFPGFDGQYTVLGSHTDV